MLGLVSSVFCHKIGWEERLQNDVFRVKWDVQQTYTQTQTTGFSGSY